MYAPVPDGEVKVLRGVPLDADYTNTLYFASAAAQSSYFASTAKYTYTQLMYIRATRRVRIPIAADSIFDCNYLMYRNQQYLNKWFYAFINQVYYVNDNCCEIDFEIDVMQTWAFDYAIKPSFIERNHTVTDIIGDNDVAENLDLGTYEVQKEDRFANMGYDWDVVMFSTFDPTTLQPSGGTLTGGSFSALHRMSIGKFTLTGTGSASWVQDATVPLRDIMTNHAHLIDGIVAIVIAPSYFEANATSVWTISKLTDTLTVPSYNVRNKKLLTAPFYMLYVADGSGSGKMFEPNKFQATSSMVFNVKSDAAPVQSVIATPENYKRPQNGIGGQDNDTEAMIMTGFPQAAWISDAFQTYMAQNQTNMAVSYAVGAAQIVGGAALAIFTEGAGATAGYSLAASGVGTIGNLLADVNDKSKRAPETHGNITGTAFMRTGNKTFIAYHLMPDYEHLKIIDDYFDMFGYAIHEVGVPNISSRPHWNYVKLRGANILPSSGTGLPASDLKKICQIFDRGVTFWMSASEVGNYNLDNRPLI